MRRGPAPRLSSLAALAMVSCLIGSGAAAQSDRLPEIIAGPTNAVPACATPDRLMQFVANRNRALSPPREIDARFSGIAALYRSLGDCVQKSDGRCIGLRWDYAFFQM